MNTTLLIMAAGIGSRFGTGIKQLPHWGQTPVRVDHIGVRTHEAKVLILHGVLN